MEKNGNVTQHNPKRKKHRPNFKMQVLAGILVAVLSIVILGAGVTAFQVHSTLSSEGELNEQRFTSASNSKIFSADNKEIYDMGFKNRENVSYDDLPQSLVDAFVAVEDSRFFVHNGFDVPRFTMAFIKNIFSSLRHFSLSFSEGGGSTFTMQLVKNTFFVYENPETGETEAAPSSGLSGISRKIQEIFIATKVENENILNKKKIFELYVNMINYGAGSNIMGIENSSKAYFGKSAKELNLVESAFMAGVINAPTANSPYNSIANAEERTHEVLGLMVTHGYITQQEYDLAMSVPIENIFVEAEPGKNAYPHQAYVDVVMREIGDFTEEKTGERLDPFTKPMRIYTTMDPEVQDGIDKFQKREIEGLDQGKDTGIQVGSAIVRNNTGEIVGVVGGYDYEGQLVYNRALDAKDQPGSTIKPFLSYALAFEYLGYATSHIVTDEPFTYSNGLLIGNYDDRYLGQITLSEAIGDSRNIPAIETLAGVLEQVGSERVVEYINSVGFDVDPDQFSLGYALGGAEFQSSPIKLASAYSMLYNGGNYIKPHTITKIEFLDGSPTIHADYQPEEVLSDSAAYLTTRMMKDVVDGGYSITTSPIRRGYTVFGKTGTNDYGEEGPELGAPVGSRKDKLMVTGTSDYSIATWTGFDIKKPEYKPWFSDEEYYFNLTGKLNGYLLDLLEDKYGTPDDISRPAGVVDITHIKGAFPYQSPLADMNPDMITTGLIKSEFANLTQAQPQDLQALGGVTANAVREGSEIVFNIQMSPYPDAEKLKVADNVLVMKYPNGGTVGGRRLYDDTWIYGAVRYKSEIRVNGNVIQDAMTDSQNQTIRVPESSGTTNYQVCSYYTYDRAQGKKSNVVCTDNITIEEKTVQVPNFIGQDISELRNWLANYGVTPSVSYQESSSLSQFNRIATIQPNYGNKTIKLSELQGTSFSVSVYDYRVTTNQGSPQSVRNALSPYVSVSIEGDGNTINNFIVNGQEVTSFLLSDVVGESITIVTN